jgi:hypothetical protein
MMAYMDYRYAEARKLMVSGDWDLVVDQLRELWNEIVEEML